MIVLFEGRLNCLFRTGLNAGPVPDAQVRLNIDPAVFVSCKGWTSKSFDAFVELFAPVLIDGHSPWFKTRFFLLLAREFQHAGMPGDYHAEFIDAHRPGYEFRQF